MRDDHAAVGVRAGRRLWRAGVAAVAVSLAVAGCAGVPTSGPVVYDSPPQAQVGSEVGVAPLPPSADASPSLVVEGFLHAMSVYQPDYAVARQYLTPAASKNWDPGAKVEVYTSDDYPVTQVDNDVVLSARLVGTLDAGGRYQASSGKVLQDFKLVRDAKNQWRISNPPTGLLISTYLFTADYVSVDLHYLSADSSVMVPDVRWLPSGDNQVLRALQLQVAGPGGWIKPLVSFASGVEVLGVATSGGLATVSLGGTATSLDATGQKAVLAELVLAAVQFSGVTRVEVTVGGVPWAMGGAAVTFTPSDFSSWAPVAAVSPEVFAVSGGQVDDVTPTTSAPHLTAVTPGIRNPKAIAVSSATQEVAALVQAKAGQAIETASIGGKDAPTTLRRAPALVAPQYSRDGELWTVEPSGLATLQVFGAKAPLKVSLADPPPGTVVSLAVSPDGTRLAVALKQEQGYELGLLRVSRSNQTVTLDGWRTVPLPDTAPLVDVAWSGPTQLLVLAGDAQAGTSVLRITQDGARSSYVGPNVDTPLVELAASPGALALVRSQTGMVYRFDADFTWPLWLSDAQAVAFAQ